MNCHFLGEKKLPDFVTSIIKIPIAKGLEDTVTVERAKIIEYMPTRNKMMKVKH